MHNAHQIGYAVLSNPRGLHQRYSFHSNCLLPFFLCASCNKTRTDRFVISHIKAQASKVAQGLISIPFSNNLDKLSEAKVKAVIITTQRW